MFDDYALPQNYGSPDPVEAQAPAPPKMRVIPNPGEQSYAGIEYGAQAPAAPAVDYGAASQMAKQAAQLAGTQPTVTPTSSIADIQALQRALKLEPDGKWGQPTTTALNNKQREAGLPQVSETTPEIWAYLFGGTEGLSEYNSQVKKGAIVGGIKSVTEWAEKLFQPSDKSIPPTQPVSNAAPTDSGTEWGKYALIAGGVIGVGLLIYFATKED